MTACIYFYADYRTETHLVVLSSCSHDESSLPDRRSDFVDTGIAPGVPQFRADARGEVVLRRTRKRSFQIHVTHAMWKWSHNTRRIVETGDFT